MKGSDFLIRYDRTAEGRRQALFDAYDFDDQVREILVTALRDPYMRAVAELAYCGTVRFEDFKVPEKAGLAFQVREYRLRVSTWPYMGDIDLTDVALTPLGRSCRIDFPDKAAASWIFPDFVETYLCRSNRSGIVVSRNLLEAALEIADVEFLRLVRMPQGPLLFENVPREGREMFLDLAPDDVAAARRSQFEWSAFDRSFDPVLHDMSNWPSAKSLWRRDDGWGERFLRQRAR